MTPHDTFLDEQLRTILRPGEQEQRRLAATSAWAFLPLVGGWAPHYYGVVTCQRTLFIRSAKAFAFRWQGLRLKRRNKGLQSFDHEEVERVVTVKSTLAGGLLGARGVRLETSGGRSFVFVPRRTRMFASGGEWSDVAQAIAAHAGPEKLVVEKKKRRR